MSKILAQGMITLTQLYEGVQVILTPTAVLIPCDSEENPKSNAYVNASTNVKAFLGTMDITSGITLGELEYSDSTVRASKTGTKVSITTITTRTGYVDIPVSATINGETIDLGKHRFNFVKQIDGQTGQPGAPGDPGFGYTLNIKGGTRGVAYAANGTNPEPKTSSQFSVELLKNGVKVANPASISWTCGGNLSGSSSAATFTPTIKSTYASESSYVKVSIKEFAASLAVEETIPIICTKHADGLDWINEWNNQYVQVGTEKIITPKIFAGTKNSANELTGVAIGRDVLGGNANKVIGIVGYKKNTPVFSLDQDANFFVSSSGSAGDIKNGTNNAKGIYFDGNNLYVSGKVKISGGSTIGESNTLVEDVINNSNLGAQANNKIDNLSIGGRNLAKNSIIINAGDAGELDKSNYISSGTLITTISRTHRGFRFDSQSIYEANQQYVLSFYIQKQSGTINQLGMTHNGKGHKNVKVVCDGVSKGDFAQANTSVGAIMDDGNIHKIEVYFTTSSNIPADSGVAYTYIQLNKETGTPCSAKITKFKLEKGTKPTDWSPAPEDINSAIDSKANSADVYKKTETYSKTQTESAIEVAKNEINLGISSTYETKTNVETKVNNAINNIQIGGRNIIGKDINNISKWSLNYPERFLISNVEYDNTLIYKTTGGGWETAISDGIAVIPNKEYVLSFEYEVFNEYSCLPGETFRVEVLSERIVGNSSKSKAIAFHTIEKVATPRKRVYITFTPTTSTIYLMINGGYIADGLQNLKFSFNKFKLEKGNKATDWTPAPEDVEKNINNAIDNIQIGGTNLFRNSGFTKEYNHWNIYQCSSIQVINEVSAYSRKAVKVVSTGGGIYQRKQTGETYYPNGTTLTVSGYVKANLAGKTLRVGFENAGSANAIKRLTIPNANTWQYFTHTHTITTDTFNTTVLYGDAGTEYYFKDLQLEYGNKPTAWSPAPDDVMADLNTKANSSDVYNKSETYTKNQTDSVIKAAKDEISLSVSNTYETKTNVETKVNNAINSIQVGGRNLFLKSDIDKYGMGFWINNGAGGTGSVEGTYIDGTRAIKVVGNSGIVYNSWIKLKRNTTYVYSMMMKVSPNTLNILGNRPLHMWLNTTESSNHLEIIQSTSGTVPANTWTKAYVVFKTPNTQDVYYMKPFVYDIGNNTVYISKVKIEEGTKPTDWTPAPEDMANDIANAKNEAINSANNTLTTTIANYYTKEQTNSQINIAKEAINLGVSNTYETKANVETKVNNAVNNIQIGGRNLFKDTKDYGHTSMSVWNKTHGSHVNTSEVYNGCKVVRITSQWGRRSQSIDCEKNAEYVISAWVKGGNTTTSIGAYCEGANIVKAAWATNVAVGTAWKRYWAVVRSGNDQTSLPIRIEPNNSSNCDLYICGLMVEKGTKPSDWTPAPEDIDSAIGTKANSNEVYKKTEVYTKNETNSQINLAKDDITLAVSNTYETKTNVETKVNNAVNNIQIGGRNLLPKNSLRLNNSATGTFDSTTNTWSLVASKGSNSWGRGLAITTPNSIVIPYGQGVTYSFEIKVPKQVSWNFDVNNAPVSGSSWNNNDHDEISKRTSSPKTITKVNEWVKCWAYAENTSTTNTNKVDLKDAGSTIGLITTNETSDVAFYIRNVKVELGNKATDWSPCPTDIDASINSKANSAEVYKKTEVYTKNETNTQIKAAKDEISLSVSNTYETKTNVENKVSNAVSGLKVGGNNLLRNGNFAYEMANWSIHDMNSGGTNKSVAIWTGGSWVPAGKKAVVIRGTNTSDRYGVISSTMKLTPNTKYTISGYCAGHRVNKIQVNVRDMQNSSANIHAINIDPAHGGNTLDKWYRFETTFTTTANTDFALNLYSINLGNDGYVWFTNVQVQEGTKATAWTPCSEDIDASINSKANSVDVYTKTETNSQINMAKDSITSTVSQNYLSKGDASNTYATKSSLTQTTNSIVAKFESSGGYNLLKNSKAQNGTNFWVNNGGGISTGTHSTYKTCFKTQAPSGMKYHESIKLKNNTEYVYEGCFFSETAISGSSAVPLHYWCMSTANTSGQSQLTVLDYRQSVPVNRWTKCYVHFRTASSGDVYFTPFVYVGGSATFVLWATELSLSESSVESKWSPHPSEIYEGSTIIDATGVTVNNGALRVKNKSGSTVLSGDSNGNLVLAGNITSSATISGGAIKGGTITGGAIQISSTVIDSTGLTVNNGAIKVKNKAGNIVLNSDSNGNLTLSGSITSSATISGGTIKGGTITGGAISGGTIQNSSTTIDSNGLTVSNGAIRVKNKSGTTVLSGDSKGNLVLSGNITSNATISGGAISGGTLRSTSGDMYFDMNNGIMILYNNGTKVGQTNKNSIGGTNIYGVTNGAEYGSYSCLAAKTSSNASSYSMMLTASGCDLSGTSLKKGITLGNTLHSNNWHFRLGSSTHLFWRQNGSNHDSFITEGSDGMLRLYGDNGVYLGYRVADSNNYVIAIRENGNNVYPKSLSVFDDSVSPATDNNGYSLEISAPLNMKGQSINQCSNIKTLGLEFIEPIAFNRNREGKTRTLKVTKSTQNIVEFIGSTAIKNGEAIVDLPTDVSFKNYVVLLTPIGLDRKVSMVEKNDDNFKIVGDDGIVDYVIKFESMDYANYIRKSISEDNTDIIVRSEEDKPKEILVEN